MTMDYSHLIGVPFGDLGRGPDSFDCWGGVIAVGKLHGIEIPDYGVHHDDHEGICSEFAHRRPEWIEISRNENPQVCDVILFKHIGDGGLHFGIVIENGRFAQVNRDLGFHIAKLSPYVLQTVQAFYRLKK